MDLQLTSIAADETRRYPIAGIRINGHRKDVALLVRWSGASEDYQRAIDAQAFRKIDRGSDEWSRAIIRLIAQHLVVGWENVPEGLTYTQARGEQILGSFVTTKRTDRLAALLAFIGNGDNFQAEIVDGEDLGNA